MPRLTSSVNQETSSYPSGTSNRGIRFRVSNMPVVSTRSAISSWVLRQPSCQASEESMAYISSADFR